TSEIEARKVEVQLCSSSYGDVKNISYPFRLKGDPAGCGHPELQLPCESNKIILEFNSGKYYVKRISYDKCTISVAEILLPEIIAVTNHFTHKLGQGGFGSVYKGQLHTGRLIAVKMLENSKFSAEEFINEVSTIGRIHSPR
ncbi:hypothetical protein CUMW_234810, partial [Citrus unshiu]